MGFLNPLFLWALPLAAVPIIIHLLNRRRYKTVRWAAMEFLLRAMKRNRRRLRMEQWLILALRTLAVLLLVMLVARPQASGSLLGGVRTHHVVILDDSASMAHRSGGGNAFDSGKEAVTGIAKRLVQNRGGDLITVVRSSNVARPQLAGAAIVPGLATRVRDLTSGWRYGDGVLDPASVLEHARRLARENEEASQTEFYLITDLRKRDWLAPDGEPNAAVSKWLGELDGETEHLGIITVGPNNADNVAITDIRCSDRVCTLGVPLTFVVEVQNKGLAAAPGSELTIEIDDKSRVVHPLPPLQPSEKTAVEITQTFHTSGWHGINAALPADRYAIDDSRSLALEVRSSSRVILVDGDPGTSEEESETYFIGVALDPGGDNLTGIDVRILAAHELGSEAGDDILDADLVVLCNVSRPNDRAVSRLEQFAANGGGVVVWLGNQIDIARYNEALYKGGEGLLPAELVGVQGDMDDPRSLYLSDKDHPLFANNTEELEYLFERWVLVGRHIALREQKDAPVRTLIRVGGEQGPALMMTHSYGENGGQVFLIGTSADTFWTNWPVTPVFMVTALEMHGNAARPQDFGSHNLLPNELFETPLDPGTHRPEITASPRRGDGGVRTFTAAAESDAPFDLEVPMSELSGYGLFELGRTAHGGAVDVELLSRNPILDESELERIGASALLSKLPEDVRDRVTVTESSDGGQVASELAGGGGLWRWLGFGMLFAMLLETILAWRFGRR